MPERQPKSTCSTGGVFPLVPLLLVRPRLLAPRAVCAEDGGGSSDLVLFRRIG